MSPRSLRGQGVSAAFIALTFLCPARTSWAVSPPEGLVPQHVRLGAVGERAFQYFAPTRQRSWDDYLKSIRPAAVSADKKARSLAMVRKKDVIEPSAERQAKLDALRPVLAYLERDVAIEVKILRLELAWAGFLGGAAVLVSEGAVDLLTAEELQAVVAHELAHEYFSEEYEAARNGKRYDTVKEIELRCDAVSIVTMRGLRLHPEALLSAVAKLTKFNDRRGFVNSANLAPSMEERTSFSRAVAELVE
jgi:Zn-dependent protease with chaperone function